MKAKIFRNFIAEVVIDFVEEHIVTSFIMSFALVCVNRFAFVSAFLTRWAFENKLIIKFSSNHYQQGNGVVESTNKNLITII